MKQNIRDDMPSRARHLSRASTHARAHRAPIAIPVVAMDATSSRATSSSSSRARAVAYPPYARAASTHIHTRIHTHTLHVPRRRRGLGLDGNLAESGGLRECAHRKGRRVRIACACEDRTSATCAYRMGSRHEGLVPGHNWSMRVHRYGHVVLMWCRMSDLSPPQPDRKNTRA